MFYTIIKGSYTNALIVIDSQGTLFYASLGDSVNHMKSNMLKHFTKLKIPLSLLSDPIPTSIQTTISCYEQLLDNPNLNSTIKVKLMGTPLQIKVWQHLMNSSVSTTTYSKVAEELGMPKSVRAIATAIGANNHAIIVPCHRVLNIKGKNTGYKWGMELKDKLLTLEKSSI